MKYTIRRVDAGFEMLAECESGERLFVGDFGLTGRRIVTEPQAELEEAWQAARRALVLDNPTMEKGRARP